MNHKMTETECPDCGCRDLLTLRTQRRRARPKADARVRFECRHCGREFLVKVADDGAAEGN
jgi:transposase-like protein